MIRQADINDLQDLAKLAALLHPPWSDASLKDVIEKPSADVLVSIGTDIEGFICVEYVAGEGCITAIAVAVTARRRGTAQELICFAESLREKTNIYLEVEETNTAAISLYEKCGYTTSDKRKNYYGKTAAIIMNKEF